MTLILMKKTPDHKLPRPMNRASNVAEMVEIMVHFIHMTTGAEQGRYRRAKEACRLAVNDHKAAAHINGMRLDNVNTDEPFLTLGTTKFYAFTEE